MNARSPARPQQGFSIVELMVAATISIIMFAVIIELFASNKEAYRVQEGASVLNENARFAISHLQFFMRLADHWGGVEPNVVSVDGGVPAALTTSCDGGANAIVSNVGFRGLNGAAAPPTDCIAAANYEPNTDAFFIRYGTAHENGLTIADDTVPVRSGIPKLPDAAQSQWPVEDDYVTGSNGDGIWISTAVGRRAVIFEDADYSGLPADVRFDDKPSTDAGRGAFYRYQAMLYYIRSCSNPASGSNANLCDAGDDGVPTLVRMTLNPDFSFTEEEIVAGVENMQLLYGVDTDEDLVAERYDTAATVQANGNWDKVVTVRVSLMIANIERDNTITDTATYNLLDQAWTVPAEARNFRRSQFDFTVQIRNMTRA